MNISNTLKMWILLFVLFSVSLSFYFWVDCKSNWCLFTEGQKSKLVNSFDDCVLLGLPIMESYPRQCRVGMKVFVEKINEDLAGPIFIGSENIKIYDLEPNVKIKSPLIIKGEARGWYFEGSFPVKLVDNNGKIIIALPAEAKGDWMTSDFVPFELEIKFNTPETTKGILIFEKDNPSGLEQYNESFSVPVVLK